MARSRSSRASSTPRLDAASISTTSSDDEPAQMRWQLAHSPQGSLESVRRSQLSAIASTRARVVLPTPRGPQSRYPCATRPRAIAPFSVAATCDCTATSAKVFGRYLRARARDMSESYSAERVEVSATGPMHKARGTLPSGSCALAPSAPGLTKRRQTPHAAATFGVLTELEGCRPPGPGTPEI